MKTKHIVATLIVVLSGVIVAKNAHSMTFGTGTSTESGVMSGTMTATSSSSENHQGIETVAVKGNGNNAKTDITQVGTYNTSNNATQNFNGTLVDTTTTNRAFTFFDN